MMGEESNAVDFKLTVHNFYEDSDEEDEQLIFEIPKVFQVKEEKMKDIYKTILKKKKEKINL